MMTLRNFFIALTLIFTPLTISASAPTFDMEKEIKALTDTSTQDANRRYINIEITNSSGRDALVSVALPDESGEPQIHSFHSREYLVTGRQMQPGLKEALEGGCVFNRSTPKTFLKEPFWVLYCVVNNATPDSIIKTYFALQYHQIPDADERERDSNRDNYSAIFSFFQAALEYLL